jgi:hypothetical protein
MMLNPSLAALLPASTGIEISNMESHVSRFGFASAVRESTIPFYTAVAELMNRNLSRWGDVEDNFHLGWTSIFGDGVSITL